MKPRVSTPRTKSAAIRRDMPIMEIVTYCPEARNVLAEYGLHCFGCAGSTFETLEEGCRGHGFGREEIDELIDDLNELFARQPSRPASLTITREAAGAIRMIAKEEKRARQGLEVIADATGGFCMEFRSKAPRDAEVFTYPDKPAVRVFATLLTLRRIGGATIDFREGRFKLDLPEDAMGCCGGSTECSCTAENRPANSVEKK